MDNRTLGLASVALVLLLACAAQVARAQSTDGYHAIQVFPVVVDTVAFTQRFHFRSASGNITQDPASPTVAVTATYYPAQGTAQPTPVACSAFVMQDGKSTTFASLRTLCPDIALGSTFGVLVVRSDSGAPFAAASRVSSPANIGFLVEAVPASDFTNGETVVTGLRRKAATAQSPAFQTNCFVGNLAEFSPSGLPQATEVVLLVSRSNGTPLGQKFLEVKPGQLIRILDVFSAAGVGSGDIEDAVVLFQSTAGTENFAGLITFCTVQDNTQFSADFRIGKQEFAWSWQEGAQDWGALRQSFRSHHDAIDNEEYGARLSIPAGASRNVHVYYFRHPDVVGCRLYDDKSLDATLAYGLELRLKVQDVDGWRVLAGGNNVSEFSGLYLGDKSAHGEGANTVYQLEVESNGQNEGIERPYVIGCSSGSGHTRGEVIRSGLPTAF